MLRRAPTSIALTPEDLAIFERQYAQGHIYADHHENKNIESHGHGYGEPRHSSDTPGSTKGDGQVAASAGGAMEGARGQADGEVRRAKTRQERIQGLAGAGNTDGSGGSR